MRSLARYDDAPVRSYTTILATRQARDCLRGHLRRAQYHLMAVTIHQHPSMQPA